MSRLSFSVMALNASGCAGHVDAFAFLENAALDDGGADAAGMDALGPQGELPVVDVDHLARLDSRQVARVVEGDGLVAPGLQVVRQPDGGMIFQRAGLLAVEVADADAEAFEVLHDADVPPVFLVDLADEVYGLLVLFVRAMREVQPNHVQTGADHLHQYGIVVAGGSQRGHDLRFRHATDSCIGILCFTCTREGYHRERTLSTPEPARADPATLGGRHRRYGRHGRCRAGLLCP